MANHRCGPYVVPARLRPVHTSHTPADTRGIITAKSGYARYLDISKNTTNQDQNVNLVSQSNSSYGITQGTMVPDPKRKDQHLGWVGLTGAGPSIVEVFSGKGAKIAP